MICLLTVVSTLFPPLVSYENIPDDVWVVAFELARIGNLIEYKPEQAWQDHSWSMHLQTSPMWRCLTMTFW